MNSNPPPSAPAVAAEIRPLDCGVLALALVAGLNVVATVAMTATTWLGLHWPALLLEAFGAAIVAAILVAWSRDLSLRRLAFALGVLCAALPSFWLAAHHAIEHWDEFMTWLPNARYVWVYGSFPTAAAPPVASVWSGYPPGSSIVLAALWSLAGRVVEHAGPILNVGCLLLLPGLVMRAVGGESSRSVIVHLGIGLMLGLAATLLNVGVEWHWVFSSLPDTAMFAVFAAAFVLAAELRFGSERLPRAHLLALAAILALIVNLKQTGIVLLVLLVVARLVVACSWRDGRSLPRAALQLAVICLPAIAVWLCWQAYLSDIFPASTFRLRPISAWDFAAVPELVHALLSKIADHWLNFLPIIAVVMRGTYVLGRRWLAGAQVPAASVDRLAALFALVQGGYFAFLIVCYLGAFSDGETRGAAQFFRYQTHVDGAGLLVAIALLVQWVPRSMMVVLAPAVLASQVAFAAVILPEPGVTPGHAVYGHAEFRELREIGRRAGALIARNAGNGRDIAVHYLSGDDYLANLIVRYEVWASAPRLVHSFEWDDASAPNLPAQFAAAAKVTPYVLAMERQGDEHCAIYGDTVHVQALGSAAKTAACLDLLEHVRSAVLGAQIGSR